MKVLKITKEFAVDTEQEAKDSIEEATNNASNNGYSIAAAGYTYKSKKSKGEIIDETYVVKIVEEYNNLWQ